MEFRDKYKNELKSNCRNIYDYDFAKEYHRVLEAAEQWGKLQQKIPKQMRSYEESAKSKKTVASMIERKGEEKNQGVPPRKSVKIVEQEKENINLPISPSREDIIIANRKKLLEKMNKKKVDTKKSPKSPFEKGGKKPRVWDLGGTNRDLASLDRSKDKPEDIKSEFTAENEVRQLLFIFL